MLDELIAQVDEAMAPEAEAEQPDYGERNEKLPAPIQESLRSLLKHYAGLDKLPRRDEVIDTRRQRYYWKDIQYIYWNAQSCVFATAEAGASVNVGSASIDMPRYTDVYNIYRPYGRSIMSVLCQNPVPVNFEPDDPMSPVDITHAKAADKYRHVVDRDNDRKALQAEIARLFWTDGRVILHTYQTGEDGKTKEKIEANGVLESKVPITAKDRSEFPYVILSREMDINQAKTEYPDAAANIKEGSSTAGESAYERMARLGVLQANKSLLLSGEAYAHLVTRHRVWLRPSAFEKADEASKTELTRLFPDGVYVTFVGDAYCEAVNESMDECIAVAHANPGDGQSRPSMGKSLIPIQDAFNDYKNLEKEMFDYGIPSTWMDSQVGDINALREQLSEPGNHISATRPPGTGSMQDAFYRESETQVPESMILAYQDLRGNLAQFVTGALPALLGESDSHNETKGGITMLRDQAMAQISIPWGAMQELYATAYTQAVKLKAKTAADDEVINVKVPGKKVEADSVSVADLKKGNFKCSPNTDMAFPETFAAKSERFMNILEMAPQNPAIASLLMQPDNLALAKEMIGLEDLVMPGEEARNKQLEEIDRLLKEQPIPPSPEQMGQAGEEYGKSLGMGEAQGPPPSPEMLMQPSVPVDPQFDYHQFEFEECQRWLSSTERREQEKSGNVAGVENVRLHALEHFKFMPKPMMGPPPEPGKPPQGDQQNGAA